MPLLVVEDVEPLRPFYADKLGFEESTYRPRSAGEGALVIFRFGTGRVGFATPNSLPDLPTEPTRNAMVVLEVPDAETLHGVVSKRAGDAAGAIQTPDFGRFFDVHDPVGTVLRFLEVTED